MIIYIKRRSIKLLLGCFVLLFAVIFIYDKVSNVTVATSSEITNWGLSFKSKGKSPVGNATPQHLKKYNSYYIGSSDEKAIYLTFDAGFENGYTPSILDTLKKHNVKAAFFLVGNYLEKNPDLVLLFYNERLQQLIKVSPNEGHKHLLDLEACYEVQIITQNVDDLHERAGSSQVLHLHGELRKKRSQVNPD